MLKRLYDKSAVLFAVLWIVAYCVLMSAGDMLSGLVGVEKSLTLPIALLMSIVLFLFLYKNRLLKDYGFGRPTKAHGTMLFYIPLLLMLGTNLIYGVTLNYSVIETVLYILTMLAVGFLEEVIFRGLLFEAMRKDSLKAAVAVSSVTFGIGHIINLINCSGAELLPNLLQVVYATAAGFMFVMIYLRSGSILPCIIAHGVFNALSAFSAEAQDTKMTVISAVALTVITGSYAIYLMLFVRDEREEGDTDNGIDEELS
ncbi:MAG: CPBP family intramembrane metalloprotease [Clostridia bacterium]|nr:CPBP family intramembrane metalloprotease [Clostridia bacterium]